MSTPTRLPQHYYSDELQVLLTTGQHQSPAQRKALSYPHKLPPLAANDAQMEGEEARAAAAFNALMATHSAENKARAFITIKPYSELTPQANRLMKAQARALNQKDCGVILLLNPLRLQLEAYECTTHTLSTYPVVELDPQVREGVLAVCTTPMLLRSYNEGLQKVMHAFGFKPNAGKGNTGPF